MGPLVAKSHIEFVAIYQINAAICSDLFDSVTNRDTGARAIHRLRSTVRWLCNASGICKVGALGRRVLFPDEGYGAWRLRKQIAVGDQFILPC